jgi:hypothetical protein
MAVSVRLAQYREGETRRRSRLLWLNDGVVVQEEPLSALSTEILQLTVLANASGLSTDLTGFSLVHNDQFRKRRDEILRAAGHALSQLQADESLFREDRDEYSHIDDQQESREAVPGRLKGALKVSGFGVAAVLSPLLSAPAVAAQLFSGHAWSELRAAKKLLASRGVVLAAIDADLRQAVELLTGDKPPPPPEKRIEFVMRRAH